MSPPRPFRFSTVSFHACLRVVLACGVIALAAPLATAEQLVIVRETRTSPDLPFGGRVRVVSLVDGAKLREEVTTYLDPITRDSADAKGTQSRTKDPEQSTAVWSPQERVWRSWSSKGEKTFVEWTADELLEQLDSGNSALDDFRGLFGVNPDIVREVEVRADSSGAEETIAGVRARPYTLYGTIRFHELSADVTDSLRLVRRLRVAWSFPGAEALPRLTPARTYEKVMESLQFMLLPMLEDGLRSLDVELAKIPGHILRDEVRVEAADEPGAPADAPADTTKSVLVFVREVTEIRREPSSPALFRVPDGYRPYEKSAPKRSGRGG